MGTLSSEKMATLERMKQNVVSKSGSLDLGNLIANVGLAGITVQKLKTLIDPKYTGFIDYGSLNLATLDTNTMNALYPGSIDAADLQKKLCTGSIMKGQQVEVTNSDAGPITIRSEVRTNGDVEDHVYSNSHSQGTDLQFTNRSTTLVNSNKSSMSFVGKETT